MPRGGFTVKLIKLKLQGPLSCTNPFQCPGRSFGNVFTRSNVFENFVKVKYLNDSRLSTVDMCHTINPLNAELNPICYLLALLGAHHFLHVSRIRVKSLTLRLLMSYICIYDISSLGVNILTASVV